MQVKYPLLVFFAGMFITVAGFNETGVPDRLWVAVEPYAHIDTSRGLLTLSLVITVLSNLASNVPTGARYIHSHIHSPPPDN